MSNIYTIANTTQPKGIITTTPGFNGVSNNAILTVKDSPAALEVKGDIMINGRNLEERLDVIEKVLNIPERDVKLEKKYPKLKKMYDEYIKELSKTRMWESLKGEGK
jgi:hypothetical protein